MRKDVQDLINEVEKIGWKYIKLDGSGHHRLVHQNGKLGFIPATPSDHRSLVNAKAALERLGGQKLAKPKAGNYQFKRQEARYIDTRTPELQTVQSKRIEALEEEYTSLALEFKIITYGEAKRSEINRAFKIIRRILKIEEIFEELHQPIPEIGKTLDIPRQEL